MHIASTNPYPWPYDGVIAGDRLALLVTGAQPAWADVSQSAADATAQICALSDAVRRIGGLVLAVRHLRLAVATPAAVPPRQGDAGAVLLPGIDALAPDVVVECAGCDATFGSTLETLLRTAGRTHVLLCGYGSEVTVDSTLRSLNDRGVECLVVTDALAPLDPDLSARILDSVTKSGGIFGALGRTADVCAALAAC